MDYKMFFRKAFSDIREYHSCPDDVTIVNDILECGNHQLADFLARYNAMTQSVNRIITEGENGHDEL